MNPETKLNQIKRNAQGEQLFDVLIYHIETRKVASVVGADMRLNSGHQNAEKRLETVLGRINELYDVGIFDAGFYAKDDIIPASDPRL